jgi:hypothetical protein
MYLKVAEALNFQCRIMIFCFVHNVFGIRLYIKTNQIQTHWHHFWEKFSGWLLSIKNLFSLLFKCFVCIRKCRKVISTECSALNSTPKKVLQYMCWNH